MKKRILGLIIVLCIITVNIVPVNVWAKDVSVTHMVSAGLYHSAFISEDNQLYTWGNNFNSQLNGNHGTLGTYRCVPAHIMENVRYVSLGGRHSAAITNDNELYLWGDGLNKQVKGDDNIHSNQESIVKVMDSVRMVELGEECSAAIKMDGSLYTWGYNNVGQTGAGEAYTDYSLCSNIKKILDNVAKVSLGEHHGAAITTDGKLYAWGQNQYGETMSSKVPVIATYSTIKNVSCGKYHTAIVEADGDLYLCGNNSYGQLGDGKRGTSASYDTVLKNVVSVSAGNFHTAAITEDGSLYTWGSNAYGQLGDGTTTERSYPVKVLDNVVSVAAGGWHTVAMKKNGEVVTWGYNGYGQLGDGIRKDSSAPVKIVEKLEIDAVTKYRSDLLKKNHNLEFYYSDDYFVDNNGYTYNHDLAKASLALELSSATKHGYDDDKSSSDKRMENIKELYKELGFREDSIKQYNYQLALSNNSDKVAYSFAMKPLYDGTYLVAVVVRGVGYGAEWRSNLHVGNDTKHTGFNVSAEEVYTNLNTYMLENNLIKKNTKIWITGYSRGAAVANLVAGKINKNQIIESNNLYAYTFATPNGVIVDENNANDSIHDNIYNIVLPYDVVPRLALQKWGYGKYGKTLMVKNRNASKDKNRENEVYFYNHTDGKTYSIGKDQTKAAEKVAKTLASIAKTPLVYKSTYENLFMDVFEGLMCYGDLSLFLFDRYGDDEILQDALVFAHENDKHYLLWELVDSDIAIPTFALMYINGIRDNANTVIKEIIKTLGAIQLVGLFSSKDDYGNVINAHFPEYYISWLYGYNNPKEIYESSTYKKLTIACPVNVNIYDSMGTLVASVINNEVVVDILPVDVIGESSEIYFYENENIDDYTIEIEAYDEGEINYSVTEYENNGIEARKINYANIPVSTGTKLSGNIPKGQSLGAEVYNLTSITNEEETTIAFTEDLTNENLQNLSVAVTVEGDGSANDIYFATKGELVTLEAKPYYDASFIGWYNENEELISEDREYSFILSESMNVTAKFTKCTAVVFTMTPKISNNKLNISSVVSSAKDIDTQYIMAIYSGNNKLIDIKIIPVSLVGNTEEEVNETFNVSLLESTPAYVKLFLWSGINDLIPLCGSSKADVQ